MKFKHFIFATLTIIISFTSVSQCNTNTSICTPGVAGPFNFIPATTPVSTCLDFWNGTAAPTYAYIILHITSSGPLNLLIDANTNSGFVDVAVFNIPAGQSPCTAIQNTANQIGCNYASASSGCNQFGTAFGCASSVPAPNVVAGQELMIVVEDWSNAQNNFTLQLGPLPGAQTGPPNPAITPVGPFCTTSPSVQLNAADMGGTWSGPGTSSTGLFNPATAGLGTHTINYAVGVAPCNSSSSTTITVNPSPVAGTASTPTTSFCGTSNIPLSLAGSAGTIQWQSGPTSTGPWTNIAGGTTANYTVNGVSSNTCFKAVVSGCGTPVNSNVICVTVTPPATVNANIDQTVCAGGSITLSGSIGGGATSSTWTAGSGTFSNASSLTSTYTPSITTGTINLTLTTNDPAGPCPAVTDILVVTVNPIATVNANVDQTICAGGTVTLAGSIGGSATSATWTSSSGTFSNALSLTSNYSPTITTGTVTLTLTTNDPSGPCLAVNDQIIITVNSLPVVNAGIDVGICLSASTTLTANGANTYSWSPSTGLSGTTTATVTATPSATTIYTVSGTNAAGCVSTDAVSVTVNPIPTVGAGVDQAVCIGASVTLSGSGASTYTWNNGVTNGAAFTPAATTTYTVTGTTAAGCINTDQVVVTVNPLPTVVANDVSVCATGTVTVSASGANTYSWSPGTSLSATTGSSVTFTAGATTSYTVTGTSTAGCVNTDPVTVTVLANAPINAGPDVAICAGASTTLTAAGGVTYTWNNGLGAGNNFSASPAVTTTYTVVGTDATGCTGTDAVTVTVNPLPIVNAGADQTVCAGTPVTLTATGAATYTWSPVITNGVAFTPAATTTYTVTGTTASGCIATDAVLVTVNSIPVVNGGADQTVCAGTQVTLTASGAATYSWSPVITNGVAFTPAATTTYTVTGTTLGCTSTDAVLVTVNPLPIVNAGTDQTVCAGTQVTLTATGSSTYTWSPVITNGAAFTPSLGSTTYSVTGTTAAGCTGTDQVIITVNPNPSPVIQGPTTYCAGNFATLSTTTTYSTYNWSTGVSTATTNATSVNNPITITVTNSFGCTGTSPAYNVNENSVITANFTETICQGQSILIHGVPQTTAGVYSQTYTLPTGCDSTANVTLVVNPLPVVNAGVDQTVCTGVATTLNATGASTYVWSPAATNGIPFTQAIGSTTYTVTGTDANGCVNTDQVVVTVNPLPTVGAGVDQAVCAGTAVTLSGSGAATYTWNNSVSNGVAFTPVVTNTYTVTGTDVNGCINTDQVVVTVNPIPTVNAGADVTICIGEPVTLSGSGAATYTWDNGVTNGTSFNPTTTTTYTVTGTTAAGCTSTDQVLVTVNPLPVVNAGLDQTVCIGTAVTLSGSGAATYSWSPVITNGVPFTPSVGTVTYTVTGTSAAGCVNTDQVVVTVNPLPIVNAGVDQAVCAGEQVTLTASGAATYSWNNSVIDGVAFTPAATTTYTVTGTSAAGCINTDQVLVTVNPIPTVLAGNDIAVCDGQTVTLTGSGANTYTWDNTVTNGVAFAPSVGTTTYTVTGTTTAGCINTDQVNVTVNAIPVVSFTPDVTLGCAPLTVNFTNTTANAANCVWTMSDGTVLTGCGTVSNTFEQPGCYDITLSTTDVNGCSSSFTAANLVCVEGAPIASFSPSANVISDLNPVVNFNNTTTGASDYVWNFGDTSPTTDEVNPSHDYSGNAIGNYIVTLIAYSPLGCTDTAYSVIQIQEELIFYVPNTFTPDNDNFNQTFQPIFTSGFDPYDYTLLIFNRWGEIIFESHDAEVGWNGSYGNSGQIDLVQDGTYTWKIEFKVTRNDERKVVIGHVNILR